MNLPRQALAPLLAMLGCVSMASAQGRMLWSREYSGPSGGADDASAIAIGAGGTVYIVGVAGGVPIGMPPLAQSNALILKYDAYGSLLWQRHLDFGGHEFAGGVVLDEANDALFVSGGHGPALPGWSPTRVAIVWCLDPTSGAVVWERRYGIPGTQGGGMGGLTLDADGGVVIAGWWEDVVVPIIRRGGSLRVRRHAELDHDRHDLPRGVQHRGGGRGRSGGRHAVHDPIGRRRLLHSALEDLAGWRA